MKLRRLSLSNFLSYGQVEVPLDEIHLAAIVGPNGSGKSSLATDAVLWALYGEGRAPGVDDYVRLGEREASVEVQFELGGIGYRVIRTRGLQGAGKSGLELARLDAGAWTPLTGDTIRDTQAKIIELLGMDCDMFVSASMVLQGRADEFTRKAPAERKAILGSVLGLGIYDRLQKAAKAHGEERQLRADLAKRDLDGIEVQLATRPGLQERALDIRRLIADAAAEVKTAETGLSETTAKLAGIEARSGQGDELRGRIKGLADEIGALDAERPGLAAKRERARKILDHRDEILAKVEEESAAKADLRAWDAKATEERELSADLAETNSTVADWRSDHRARLATARAGLDNARQKAKLLEDVSCDRRECQFLGDAFAARDGIAALATALETIDNEPLPGAIATAETLTELIRQVAYDPQVHQAVRNQLAELARWTSLAPQLETAEATISETAAREAEIAKAIEAKTGQKAGLNTALEAAVAEQGRAEQARSAKATAETLVASGRAIQAAHERSLGEVEGQLKVLDSLADRKAALRAELAAAVQEAGLWATLTLAFGRNGVPALLIDSAIPRIEDFANDLLGRMTSGRMSLQLTTQRETGKHTMAETLDIIITDELGPRPYAMWSGAEKFGVDISLRVAVAKLLAQRAGRRIECLVIDEGLGSLDADARRAFLEAVQVIAADFAQVLIISHIAELADALPQRIEIAKGPSGSEVRVMT